MTILSFHPCFGADKQIILGARSLSREDRMSIDRADAILLPQGCSEELYHACAQSGAPVFPEYGVRFQYPGKTGQAQLFRELLLPHPETYCWKNVADFRLFLEKRASPSHRFPFFVKIDGAHEGEGVFFIEDETHLQDVLGQLKQREASGTSGFLTQAAVPTRGNVLRAVIIGNDIFSFWKRPSEKGGMITNISKGGLLDRKWRPDLQEKAVVETRNVSRKTGLNLAAIDFAVAVDESDPRPLFLEINYFFARRGLGGTMPYYRYLYRAIREWLAQKNLDPDRIVLY
ncbi:MAG: hypothetical protein JRI80_01225 [Deltaproteobacteria bacterium]|nr:hypothetical protein [Deltaproteobacteria bacterium]